MARRSIHLGPIVTTIVTGLSGYIVLVIAARALSPADNAHFLVYWGLQYMVFGTLVGITLETTRSVFRATDKPTGISPDQPHRTPIVWLTGAIAVVTATGICMTGLSWAPHVLGTEADIQLTGLCFGTVLFALQSTVTGVLAGHSDIASYSRVLSFEAVTRLALVALIGLAAPSVPAFALAASLAAGAWLVFCVRQTPVRNALSACGTEPDVLQTTRLLAAMGSAGASAVLVVGFPVLVALTATKQELAVAAPVLLAVSLTRAPLVLPLSIYQNLIVTHVAERGVQALRTPVVLIVAGSVLGAALAYVIGPWTLNLVRNGYHVSPGVLAGLVLAAGCTALITMSGAVTLAVGFPVWNLVGWLVAAATGTGLLTLGLPLDHRIVVALVVGPSTGMTIHLIGLAARRRRQLERRL